MMRAVVIADQNDLSIWMSSLQLLQETEIVLFRTSFEEAVVNFPTPGVYCPIDYLFLLSSGMAWNLDLIPSEGPGAGEGGLQLQGSLILKEDHHLLSGRTDKFLELLPGFFWASGSAWLDRCRGRTSTKPN